MIWGVLTSTDMLHARPWKKQFHTCLVLVEGGTVQIWMGDPMNYLTADSIRENDELQGYPFNKKCFCINMEESGVDGQ